MRRALSAAMLLVAANAAAAWPACDQKGIEPPVPIRQLAPAFPPAVRETGIEGSVEVALTVLRDGRVGWVQVIRADPPGYFEQAAAAGVRQWLFEPARANGEIVECRMRTRVRFTLADTVDAPGAAGRPTPRVSQHDEKAALRGDPWAASCRAPGERLPCAPRCGLAALRWHWSSR